MPRLDCGRRFPKSRKTQGTFLVELEHTSAPDAQGRLARAYDLVLRAAARAKKQDAAHEGAPIRNTEQEADDAK